MRRRCFSSSQPDLHFFFQSEILCFSSTCLWFSVMSWTFSTFSVHRETLSHHVLIPNGRQRNLLKDVDLDPQFSIELLTNNKRVCDGSTILGARSLFPFCSVLFRISLNVTGILFVGGLIFFYSVLSLKVTDALTDIIITLSRVSFPHTYWFFPHAGSGFTSFSTTINCISCLFVLVFSATGCVE